MLSSWCRRRGELGRLVSSLTSVRFGTCSQTSRPDQQGEGWTDRDKAEFSLAAHGHGKEEEWWRKDVWKMRKYRFTSHVINLVRKGKVEEARDVFSHMLARKVRPDAAVFNSLIAGYGRKGDIRTAFKLFNDMKKRAIVPTDHTYTSIFSACSRAGPRSLDYLSKIRDEVDRRNVVLNTIASNALISALASCGKYEEAFEVYSDMQKAQLQPQAHTFSSLLSAAASDHVTGLMHAQRMWSEMMACGIRPDVQCYSLLLQCLRDAGVPQGMRRGVEEEEEGEEGEGGVGSECKGDVVVRPWAQAPFSVSRDQQLTLFLGGGRRRWERRRERKEVRWLKKEDSSWLLGEAGKVEVKLFHLLASLVLDPAYLLAEMEKRRVRPDAALMVAAIRTQAHLGNFQLARSLHNQAESMGLALDQAGYQAIASGCVKIAEGDELLTDIRAAGQVPNEYVYGTLVSNAARSRNYDYLTQVLKEMKRDEVLPNQFISDVLVGVASHKPKGEKQQKKYNGFNGYYQLWKRTMCPE